MPSPVQSRSRLLPMLLLTLGGTLALLSAQDQQAEPIPAPVPEPPAAGFDGLPLDPSRPVTISILSPQNEEVVTDATVDVFFQVDNYQLANGGNRLHVIIDNDSPLVHDNVKKPLILRGLAEGGHTLRVYAVRPNGVLLNDPSAFATTYFFVHKKSAFQNYTNPDLPCLTVNQPFDGVNTIPDDGKVWFDFRTTNGVITPGGPFAVKYSINGAESTVNDLKPIYWMGLKPGRYELIAELVDAEGQPVSGIFNRVKRSFEVRIAPRALPAVQVTPVTGNQPPPP